MLFSWSECQVSDCKILHVRSYIFGNNLTSLEKVLRLWKRSYVFKKGLTSLEKIVRSYVFGKDCKVLRLWKRHLSVLILQLVLCVVWKTSTQACFTMAYTGEKNFKKQIKKQALMVLPVFPKVSLSNNFPMLNIYNLVPHVMKINRYN